MIDSNRIALTAMQRSAQVMGESDGNLAANLNRLQEKVTSSMAMSRPSFAARTSGGGRRRRSRRSIRSNPWLPVSRTPTIRLPRYDRLVGKK